MDDRRPVSFLNTELINVATHGVGLMLSIAGLVALVTLAASRGGTRHVVAYSVYGSTLIILYLASTFYHSVTAPRAKLVLRVIDHIAIYLLIAGTYTPFTLLTLRGGWGWSLFGVVWGLALLGSLFKILFIGRFAKTSLVIYLLMGWMVLVGIEPLLASAAPRRVGVAAGRGSGLHARRRVLRPEVDALPPRDLACLRHGRQRLPLLRGAAAHPPAAELSRVSRGPYGQVSNSVLPG